MNNISDDRNRIGRENLSEEGEQKNEYVRPRTTRLERVKCVEGLPSCHFTATLLLDNHVHHSCVILHSSN